MELFAEVKKGRLDELKQLKKEGANFNKYDNAALLWAVNYEQMSIVDLLI